MKIDKNDALKIILGLSFIILLFAITMSNDNNQTNNQNNDINNNKPIIENNKNDTDKPNKEPEKTIYDKLNKNNYSFTSTINVNNLEQHITGTINNSTVDIIIDNQNIIRNIDDFNNINENFKYINIDYLKRIIDLANINNKDENNNIITYDIDIIDLIDIYNPEIDYDSFNIVEVDKMIITFNDGYIKNIELDYTNYFKYIDSNNNNLNIKIEYNY